MNEIKNYKSPKKHKITKKLITETQRKHKSTKILFNHCLNMGKIIEG